MMIDLVSIRDNKVSKERVEHEKLYIPSPTGRGYTFCYVPVNEVEDLLVHGYFDNPQLIESERMRFLKSKLNPPVLGEIEMACKDKKGRGRPKKK